MPAAITLYERRQCVLKVEAEYGTDASPTGAADSMQTIEGKISYQADKLDRKIDKNYLGADPFVLINKRGMIEYEIEMIGAGTAGNAAPIGPTLRACAHSEVLVPTTSATYAPVSSAFDSASAYFAHAGLLFKLTGIRGTIDWECTIDARVIGKVKLTGLIVASTPTEAAISGFTIAAFQRPPVVTVDTWTITVGGEAVNARSLTLTQGADPVIFHGSEMREVSHPKRASTGRLLMFQEALATLNPWAVADAETTIAIVSTVDGGAGKTGVLTIPAAQLELAAMEPIEGAAGWAIPFTALPTGSGNNEYAWAFT
jgi:hypothetical protein